ncbi:C45 family autoproteolytic acyltransferase/hydrolase [Saxibacter everestensis]|uniref:C45 family autoproteolytic acyltransferase/hydrolase n=1 Tax=Saxibacter everestensis TaxID=2909229 RepID=A0ABY8QR78_9MICO|nr:C45 family autoproteolytic acyltransferase/hydrolase [Brevibacteriaceae bacterium ZFBP1038]
MTRAEDVTPELLEIDEPDDRLRGKLRGELSRAALTLTVQRYERLFHALRLADQQIRSGALRCLDAIDRWAPEAGEEIRGTAEGSGLEVWQIAALNSRTEILSAALGARPGECSTVVSTKPRTLGAQTWDWHEELSESWHVQRITGQRFTHVGLTEYGILGKIGLNSAGLGVMFNILAHSRDESGGVPVHVVAARVLGGAGSVAEAVDILSLAPVRTSSAITVLDRASAVTVELSPAGHGKLVPENHRLLHTNHFLDPKLSFGEKAGVYEPDSQQRLALLETRTGQDFHPVSTGELHAYLHSTEDDGAELCCQPAAGAPLGQRWSTLATVTITPEDRAFNVMAGSPATGSRENSLQLTV